MQKQKQRGSDKASRQKHKPSSTHSPKRTTNEDAANTWKDVVEDVDEAHERRGQRRNEERRREDEGSFRLNPSARLTNDRTIHRNEQHAVQVGRESHRRAGCGEDRRTVQTGKLHLGRRRRRRRSGTCEEGLGRRTCEARTQLTSSWSACIVRTMNAFSSASFCGRDPTARSVSGRTVVRPLMRDAAAFRRGSRPSWTLPQ
mmetsp:Transcript_2241/g.14854  ORF Transcript_2241/g.14854 Transcript_2241/m.14854 type:complete len:201 (+) Transcript_2241:367-969(+)